MGLEMPLAARRGGLKPNGEHNMPGFGGVALS
jgi:hypothetical protein